MVIVEEYLDQWSAFPAAKHDDMVDSSTQALSYLLGSGGGSSVVRREEAEAFLGGGLYEVY